MKSDPAEDVILGFRKPQVKDDTANDRVVPDKVPEKKKADNAHKSAAVASGADEPTQKEESVRRCSFCSATATTEHVWNDGRSVVPTCSAHPARAKYQIERARNGFVIEVRAIESITTTANVSSVPVPIGPPLEKKKKTEKKTK